MPDRDSLPDRSASDARERAATALADRISIAMVRREDESPDVCRWHRDLVDLVVDAADPDFDRLRAENVRLREEGEAFTVTGDELDRALGRAERAEAENVRLREALRAYGQHKPGCRREQWLPCGCGLETALATDEGKAPTPLDPDEHPLLFEPTVGHCSKCGDARSTVYTCRDGGETVAGPGADVQITGRSWDPKAAGRRAVEKHEDALTRLSDEQGASDA